MRESRGVDGLVEPGHDGGGGVVIPDLIRNPDGVGGMVLPIHRDPLITIFSLGGEKRTGPPIGVDGLVSGIREDNHRGSSPAMTMFW